MRARGIKPGFFKNEDLAAVSPMARLLYVGLWCLADRAGRLEDRPKRIKAELFPYDKCDVDALLGSLAEFGFIQRYGDGENRYIAIPKFELHQNPHRNEAASIIPAPGDFATLREDSGTARVKESTTRADSLTPDSLTPDSLTPDSLTPDSLIPEGALALYHECCPSLPSVRILTDTRKRRLANLIAERGDDLRAFFERVEGSNFLSGRQGQWRADFDFITKPENIPKILEGSYDNRAAPGKAAANVSNALRLVEQYRGVERDVI